MIRKIKKDDFSQFKKLSREFMIDYNKNEILKGIQSDFMQYKDLDTYIPRIAKKCCSLKSSQKAIYVYEENDKLLGYIYGEVCKNPDRTLSIVGHVEDWFVSKGSRGKKIGMQLWDKMMDYFRSKHVQIIKLEVFAQNKNAYKLYKKMRFEALDIVLLKRLN